MKPYNDSLYGEHPMKKYSSIPSMSVDAYSLCPSGTLEEAREIMKMVRDYRIPALIL